MVCAIKIEHVVSNCIVKAFVYWKIIICLWMCILLCVDWQIVWVTEWLSSFSCFVFLFVNEQTNYKQMSLLSWLLCYPSQIYSNNEIMTTDGFSWKTFKHLMITHAAVINPIYLTPDLLVCAGASVNEHTQGALQVHLGGQR